MPSSFPAHHEPAMTTRSRATFRSLPTVTARSALAPSALLRSIHPPSLAAWSHHSTRTIRSIMASLTLTPLAAWSRRRQRLLVTVAVRRLALARCFLHRAGHARRLVRLVVGTLGRVLRRRVDLLFRRRDVRTAALRLRHFAGRGHIAGAAQSRVIVRGVADGRRHRRQRLPARGEVFVVLVFLALKVRGNVALGHVRV